MNQKYWIPSPNYPQKVKMIMFVEKIIYLVKSYRSRPLEVFLKTYNFLTKL